MHVQIGRTRSDGRAIRMHELWNAVHTHKKDGERDALRLTLYLIYDYAIPKSASQGVGRILRPYNLPCFDRS